MKRVFTQTYAVVGAIIEKDGKILLVREGEGLDKGKWNQPAGWVEVGENPLDAVKKEVEEETGFEFNPTHILGIYSLVRKEFLKKDGEIHHPVKIIFTGIISAEKKRDLTEEISEIKWFAPEEINKMDLSTLRDLDIKKEVRDYFSGKRYPLELITHTISKR